MIGGPDQIGVAWDLESHDGVATLSAGDALVVLWRSGATVPRIRWVRERAVARITARPAGIVSLQLLLPSATPPGLTELGELRRGMRVVAPRARSLIVLPLGDGRWRDLVRTLMRAGLAVVGHGERVRIVSSMPEALDRWTAAASEATPAHDRVAGALGQLFEAVGAPGPR